MISLRNRDVLDEKIVEELDSMSGSIRRHFTAEHNEDGSHGNINPDSITLSSGQMGVWIDLRAQPVSIGPRFFAAPGSVLTVADADLKVFRMMFLGDLAIIQIIVTGATIATDVSDELYIAMPEIHMEPHENSSSVWAVVGMCDWRDTDGDGDGPVWAINEQIATPLPRTIIALGKYDNDTFTYRAWQIGANNVNFSSTFWVALTQGNIPVNYDT